MKIQYLVFLLSFFLLGFQNPPTPYFSSACSLHFDKPFYVTGEYIWFKVYLPIDYREQNIALRASLYDVDMNVHKQFFMLTDGNPYAFGYFKIPFDWKTGTYQLAISGKDNTTDENVRLIVKPDLRIFNDLEEESTVLKAQNHSPQIREASTSDSKNKSIQIQLASDGVVRALEKVEATIDIKDKNGNPIGASLSVVVRDWSLNHDSVSSASIQLLETSLHDFSPSLSDEIHLWHQSTKPIENNLISTFLPDDHQFLFPSIASKTKLLLKMPSFEGEKTLQFLSLTPEDVKIEMREPSLIKPDFASSNEYNPNISHYLQQSRLRKKIYQLYGTTESNPTIPITTHTQKLLPSSNRSIRLADYEYFPTLPLFLKEVSTALKYRKVGKGSYGFKMFNATPDKRVFHHGSPIFIVDGQLTRNSDFIAAIDVNEMETLDLFFNDDDLKEYFGPMGRSGIVYLTTKSKELNVPAEDFEDIFTVNGVQALPTFPIQQDFDQSEIPHFSPVVYWHPDLKADAQGKCAFSFEHGHDKGSFVIEVVAQTIEGELLIQQIFYEVK